MIGLINTRHLLNQSDTKPIATLSQAFSRAWHWLHAFASSSHWLIVLFMFVVIGHYNLLLWFWFYDTQLKTASCNIYFVLSLLKYATKDSTLAESVDPSQAPEKDVLEKEKAALKKLLPLVEKFVHEKSGLQVS